MKVFLGKTGLFLTCSAKKKKKRKKHFMNVFIVMLVNNDAAEAHNSFVMSINLALFRRSGGENG